MSRVNEHTDQHTLSCGEMVATVLIWYRELPDSTTTPVSSPPHTVSTTLNIAVTATKEREAMNH